MDLKELSALADAIIPPDGRDGGASSVQAAQKIAAGPNAALYKDILETARSLAGGRALTSLAADELHRLVGELREKRPGFFKQLRMDVSALYLSDPEVWKRIGFPGPSTASGGYPDFDQEP